MTQKPNSVTNTTRYIDTGAGLIFGVLTTAYGEPLQALLMGFGIIALWWIFSSKSKKENDT